MTRTKDLIPKYHAWMQEHINTFYGQSSVQDENIKLKEIHTQKVCDLIDDLCRSESCSEDFSALAHIAALFHDLGRFTQFAKYGTFRDNKSEDHAALSVQLLKDLSVLSEMDPWDASLIKLAIGYHNRPALPLGDTAECLKLTTLLRDADKLDIFRVVTEYYQRPDKSVKNTSLELDLNDSPSVSSAVLYAVRSGSTILAEDLHSLNDFKCLQMNWVSDLHFTRSFRILAENRYLEIIRDSITDTKNAALVWKQISPRLQRKLHKRKR